jgi:hypothetical protein
MNFSFSFPNQFSIVPILHSPIGSRAGVTDEMMDALRPRDQSDPGFVESAVPEPSNKPARAKRPRSLFEAAEQLLADEDEDGDNGSNINSSNSGSNSNSQSSSSNNQRRAEPTARVVVCDGATRKPPRPNLQAQLIRRFGL